MREEVVGHDFRKRKLLTQTHHIQNFASQSGLRPPHLSLRFTGQSILLRKTAYSELCFAKWSSTTASWSKHFATQNGLRPSRFLRGAYFAVHKRQRSSLFLTAPFSSGCILVRSVFAILRVSSLTNKKLRLVKPQNDFVKIPIGIK